MRFWLAARERGRVGEARGGRLIHRIAAVPAERRRLLLLLRVTPGRSLVLVLLNAVVAATPTLNALATGQLVYRLLRPPAGGNTAAVGRSLTPPAVILVVDQV